MLWSAVALVLVVGMPGDKGRHLFSVKYLSPPSAGEYLSNLARHAAGRGVTVSATRRSVLVSAAADGVLRSSPDYLEHHEAFAGSPRLMPAAARVTDRYGTSWLLRVPMLPALLLLLSAGVFTAYRLKRRIRQQPAPTAKPAGDDLVS